MKPEYKASRGTVRKVKCDKCGYEQAPKIYVQRCSACGSFNLRAGKVVR